MRRQTLLFLFLGLIEVGRSQNVGIGNTDPIRKLHISGTDVEMLNLENTSELNVGVRNGILFTDGLNGANNYKYTGAIRSIGMNTTEARLGLFTYASSTSEGLLERLTILDNGKVGIGNTNPSYSLSVNGNGYFSGPVGIETTPSVSYALSVAYASRFYNDLRIDGILNPNNQLNIGNDVAIEGALTVLNGYGIVRNVSSTQLKIKKVTASFNASNFSAGGTLTSGYLGFGENYSSVSVFMGDVVTGTGDYAKIYIVPFDVDVVNDRCRFKITNVGQSAVTFTGTWSILLVGY